MKLNLPILSLFFGLTSFAVIPNIVFADVYAYRSPSGESILTDKRINKKGYRLLKTYQTGKKTTAPVRATVSAPKKISRKKTTVYQNVPASANLFRCGDTAFIKRKQQQYKPIIRAYAAKYGVEEALIYSVVKQESCFNEKARSHVGAMGLMQLMPATAKDLQVKNPWNPEQNIHGGVKYLSWMLKRFKGNKQFALAAYNAGPGRVTQYGGIPPFRETRNYVKKIMADYNRMKTQGL